MYFPKARSRRHAIALWHRGPVTMRPPALHVIIYTYEYHFTVIKTRHCMALIGLQSLEIKKKWV